MANAKERKQMEQIIRPEDLEELQEFRKELQARIDHTHDDGRAYLMAQYTAMMATVSCTINRISARFERDSLASTRKMLKALKEEQKEQQKEQQDNS